VNSNEILYNIDGITNCSIKLPEKGSSNDLTKHPISIEEYKIGFDHVIDSLNYGNSYLTNYTCQTPIDTNLSLKDIFVRSKAKYKLWVKDKFVVFSPEIFIKINKGIISSYPMKGTIDANIENAEQIILNDPKESAEHATIVDLIRNDLSMVAKKVEVTRYRYTDTLYTNPGKLLQVSSEIQGEILPEFQEKTGELLFNLLPAGSISGAPKNKTCQIIEQAETRPRGFYTGIVGTYNNGVINSGVMIRFIEKKDGKLYYQSGGGITVNSKLEKEYQEMVDKVYFPF
jgi:para-aminobenzoate synthetase component 1